ncbi:MAG: hypothetical protein OXF07_06175 [Rhodobacter sp.]|nr:hypothetical protein [Rhodobacter sp.]MCY4169420.1 hypothetical protein [Rhodobacter sp.]MCY4242395.1 hypothetical protein [Rhodobacter sp.]
MQNAIHRTVALIGGLAVIGTLALFAPQPAGAWGVGFGNLNFRAEPTKYRRHVLCNEAWRASAAATWQQCDLRGVHWDSYRNDLPNGQGYGYVSGEAAHMAISVCWVHIKCDYGTPLFARGEHWGKRAYPEVDMLRRCSGEPHVVNATCEALTNEEVLDGWAEYRAQQSSQSSGGNGYQGGCGQNAGGC